LEDRRLAKIVKCCRELPGYELFQYVDEDGGRVSVDSGMVNEYLRENTGEEITAKDFRTWHGTVHAAKLLAAAGVGDSESATNQKIVDAIKGVAGLLGNRPATCRKYYVDPRILDLYGSGKLCDAMSSKAKVRGDAGLCADEKAVLRILLSAK